MVNFRSLDEDAIMPWSSNRRQKDENMRTSVVFYSKLHLCTVSSTRGRETKVVLPFLLTWCNMHHIQDAAQIRKRSGDREHQQLEY